jgi:hypothetical protein
MRTAARRGLWARGPRCAGARQRRHGPRVGRLPTTILAVFLTVCYSEEEKQAPAPLPQDKAALLRHLEKTSPETLALARDWEDVAWALTTAQAKLDKHVRHPRSLVSLTPRRLTADPHADALS